ncbi:MAG: DNA/RNA non-specific endonuclease [Lachnospiraceae bacterium]|nr:DNA/RNA non-specific endonuclease [Lachnospiraceae bacterium]
MRKIKICIAMLTMALALTLTGCTVELPFTQEDVAEKIDSAKETATDVYNDVKNSEAVNDAKERVSEAIDTMPDKISEFTDENIPDINDILPTKEETSADKVDKSLMTFNISDMPEYNGSAWVDIHGGRPYFISDNMTTEEFTICGELDSLKRPIGCFINVSPLTMPTEERGEIGQVKPAGWHTVKYPDFIEDNYLYNRCHLIAHCVSGINADERNLITGTRYLNVDGMLDHEVMVAQYVEQTGNHVLYRVTPVYNGDELLCRGVVMEACSVEDKGALSFCIYAFNVQPYIEIDYATGDSRVAADAQPMSKEVSDQPVTYILNKNSKKFHTPTCESVNDIKERNKKEYSGSREDLINEGYTPCQRCNP